MLESAKQFYYQSGYTGIGDWITENDFYVTIYNFHGLRSNVGGRVKEIGSNRMRLRNNVSQEKLNIYYAHEAAHLGGYTEAGAYAITAALLGSRGKLSVLRSLMREIKKDPSLKSKLPKEFKELYENMFTKEGIDPSASDTFYNAYQQWGKNILTDFSSSNNNENDDDSWWDEYDPSKR